MGREYTLYLSRLPPARIIIPQSAMRPVFVPPFDDRALAHAAILPRAASIPRVLALRAPYRQRVRFVHENDHAAAVRA